MWWRLRKTLLLISTVIFAGCTMQGGIRTSDNPSEVKKRWGVQEAKPGQFVFCEIKACPAHSIKHLYVTIPPVSQRFEIPIDPIPTKPIAIKSSVKKKCNSNKKYNNRSKKKYRNNSIRGVHGK